MRTKNYYEHIDGLRAIAVAAVFLCHLDFSLFKGGFVGVDIFFVISGFLITNIIVQQLNSPIGFSFIGFYERRIKRIFPALFFTLFISFIASILLLNASSFKVFGKSVASASLSISNIFFKNQSGYFDLFSQSNPLLHTWSLGVEEQFYIFFPIIIFLWHKFFKKNISIIIILIFTISFLLNLYYQHKNLIALYYLVQYRAFEFCIGALILYLINFKIRLNFFYKEILCLTGIIFILIPILTYSPTTLFPSYNALMPCIGAALVIYTGTTKYTGYIFRSKPARWLGLISYSLYLIHWPLIVFFKTYHQDYGLKFGISFNEKIFIIVLAIASAYFMYSFIEQPFRKKQYTPDSKTFSLKPLAQGLCLASLVAFGGILIGKSHGWLWRVNSPEELAKIDDISQYHVQSWGGAGFNGEFIYQGKTNYAQIVLMGDSHAGMLDEGIVKEIAQPNQISVFTVSGGGAGKYASSLLLPGITRLDKNQKIFDDSARTAYKEAIKKIHETNEKSILILSASWSEQLNLAASLTEHHALNIDTSTMSAYKNYKPFINALNNLLKLLGNKKLIIIGDVPGSLYSPINCLGGLKWFKRDDCSLADKANLNVAALNINKILALYASKKSNVYFLNPYKVFCNQELCFSNDNNGKPYYSDSTHLSKIGSIFLISHLKSEIIEILNS